MKRSTVVLLVVVAVLAVALWGVGLGLGGRAPGPVTPGMEWLEPRHVPASELRDVDRCVRRLDGRDAVVVPSNRSCTLEAGPGSFFSRRALRLSVVPAAVLHVRITPTEGERMEGDLPEDPRAPREGSLPIDRSGAAVTLTCKTPGRVPEGSGCRADLR